MRKPQEVQYWDSLVEAKKKNIEKIPEKEFKLRKGKKENNGLETRVKFTYLHTQGSTAEKPAGTLGAHDPGV